MLEDLDDGERRAGQNRLLLVLGCVEEASVVIHVVKMLVAETLDVLGQVDGFLDVLVVSRVLVEDRVVDDDAIDFLLLVSLHDFLFKVVLFDGSEIEVEATGRIKRLVSCCAAGWNKAAFDWVQLLFFACLLGPFGIFNGGGVVVGEERS